ncbi:MAG: glucose 1-dehydrogenase [Thermoplasmataceae archaeon]
MGQIGAIITKPPSEGVTFQQIEGEISIVKGIKVRPLFTGICGTDRGIVRGSLKFAYEPKGDDFLVLGHECIGQVESSNSPLFKSGDLVVPIVRRPGNCPNCRIGRPDNCSDGDKHEAGITGLHGFMREYFYETPENLVPVLNKDLWEIGVLTEPLKNVVKAFEVFEKVSSRYIFQNQYSTYEGKKALIIGSANEAFLYSFMAREYRFETYMLNRHPIEDSKLEMCKNFGVNFVDYSKENNFPENFDIDLIVDTSGDPSTITRYLRKAAYNAIIILFGTNGNAPNGVLSGLDVDWIVERNITICGSVDAARIHYEKALDLIQKWHLYYPGMMKKMITGVFKPEETTLFTTKPQGEIKSVIKWNELK